MKKTISIVLAVILTLGAFSVLAFAAGPTVTLKADKTTVNVGDTVTLTGSVSANSKLGVLDFNVKYDNTVFQVVAGSMQVETVETTNDKGQLITTPIFDSSIVNEDFSENEVKFIGTTAKVATLGGALFSVKFKAVKAGAVDFAVEMVETCDDDYNPVSVSASSLKVTVAEKETPTEPEKPTEHTHAYGGWVVTKEATCTENGERVKKCACGDEKKEVLKATGHDHDALAETKAPTCTEAGEKSAICKKCKAKISEPIAALGHKYGEQTVTKPATCTEEGEKAAICKACGEKVAETIAKLGHSYGEAKIVTEATCRLPGLKVSTCANCKDEKREIIPMLEHNYADPIVTEEPTCAKVGKQKEVCIDCDYVKTTEIPMLEHTVGEWEVTKKPTKTEEGEKVKKCTVCNTVLEKEVLPKLPEFTKGDITGDGEVKALDARNALKINAGMMEATPELIQAGDVTGDGQITALDARWILQHVAGLRPTL